MVLDEFSTGVKLTNFSSFLNLFPVYSILARNLICTWEWGISYSRQELRKESG